MRWFRLVLLAAAIAGLGYGGRMLYQSDLMKLERVEVVGNSRVSANEIVAASRLTKGRHLLSLSASEVGARIEKVAWVSDARVERILPSRVRITVEERIPVASVVVDAQPYLVDREGRVLAEGTAPLFTITDLPLTSIAPGRVIKLRQFEHVMTITADLPEQIAARVASISAPSVDRITLVLKEDVRILYGAAEAIREKNFAMEQLLAREPDAISIDVRVPHRPAVRPR